MSLSRSLLEELREFETPLLANTIDQIDPTPAHEFYLSGEIQSVTPSLGPTVGIAFTAEVDSSSPGGAADTALFWQQLEAMADCPLPVVWVVKTVGSRPEHECVLGDGMAKSLWTVGCVAAVTDGRVRDVAGLLTTPFAAYCRGRAVHHAALRVRAIDRPIEVGGVLVHPGEVIHGGTDGVIRIPPGCVAQLPEAALRMRAFESDAHRYLRRTDVSPPQKRAEVTRLLAHYGFGVGAGASDLRR